MSSAYWPQKRLFEHAVDHIDPDRGPLPRFHYWDGPDQVSYGCMVTDEVTVVYIGESLWDCADQLMADWR